MGPNPKGLQVCRRTPPNRLRARQPQAWPPRRSMPDPVKEVRAEEISGPGPSPAGGCCASACRFLAQPKPGFTRPMAIAPVASGHCPWRSDQPVYVVGFARRGHDPLWGTARLKGARAGAWAQPSEGPPRSGPWLPFLCRSAAAIAGDPPRAVTGPQALAQPCRPWWTAQRYAAAVAK